MVRSDHNEGLGNMQISLSFSSVAERRRRKTQERISFSTLPAGVFAAIRWASVLDFVAGCLPVHAECLPVQPSIRSVI